MKPVHIKFCIENPYFAEVYVWVKWDFPFLPRVGESISPWLWIKHVDLSKVKEKLTSKGDESFNRYKEFGSDDFESWLYDVACESDCVAGISYNEYQETDISLFIVLREKP